MSHATYPHHPAADLFPMLSDSELQDLADDIAANGLLEPVWLYADPDRGDVLLDGRNRVKACAIAGVAPATRRYTGGDPIGFALSQNLRRRHLTNGQRAAVGEEVLPLYEAEAAKRKAHGETAPGKPSLTADLPQASRAPMARDRAAAAVGTSGRAIAQYKRVKQAAPDLADKVKSGDVALDRAERIVRDRQAEQRRIDEARRQAAAAPIQATVDIRHGDFREVLADLTDVDAIITDPPYPGAFLPLLADLAVWADKVLAPDGVLAVLMGQTYLPDVYRLLDGYRPYRWTGCYLTLGAGYASMARRVQSNWKPLIVYGGGPRFSDVVRSEGTDAGAKAHHKWGQDYNAFHTIVERLTKPGQIVVDPFMGSGTTLLAAAALGRHAIGCDTDQEHVATARERLAA